MRLVEKTFGLQPGAQFFEFEGEKPLPRGGYGARLQGELAPLYPVVHLSPHDHALAVLGDIGARRVEGSARDFGFLVLEGEIEVCPAHSRAGHFTEHLDIMKKRRIEARPDAPVELRDGDCLFGERDFFGHLKTTAFTPRERLPRARTSRARR